jgi:aldose 1-epimerase
MPFTISQTTQTAGDKTGEVFTLTDSASGVSAEVWPFMGFNCLRWVTKFGLAFYTAPDWSTNPVPTRSGHPILFPFPNRLKAGKFTFEGREYQLPLNESTGQHAIHGFTPRNAWRVTETLATADYAEISGQFQISVDAPAMLAHWPGDLILTVTYHLTRNTLEVRCRVQNPGPGNVPFGLGYHPYFVLPGYDGSVDALELQAPARSLWVAENSLASGEKIPTPAEVDFTRKRVIGNLSLDHLYGDLPTEAEGAASVRAVISHPSVGHNLSITTDPAFRELLLFTPAHRRAIAVEPYTCATDAANFAARGIHAGWRILAPQEDFGAAVRYSCDSV